MTDDRWTDADDALLAMHMLPTEHPVALTAAIWEALDDYEANSGALSTWVTPECRDDWGDFSTVSEALASQALALVGTARQRAGEADIAFVWLIRKGAPAAPARMSQEDEAVIIGAIFTWVWRPELGGWRLHSVGGAMPEADRLPRTSPNAAPAIDFVEI